MGSIKKNFIYNVIYQLLNIMLPLVTIPYVSRVLGADGIGEYSYTYSIVYYFMIFAMLGLNNYGSRTIAKTRDDRKRTSEVFKEIRVVQKITSVVMITLYLIYCYFISKKFYVVGFIQTIYLISCFLDINWFFFGMEKFNISVIRNIIIKFISLFLIFIFVKEINDVWIYTLILSGCTLVSQLILWPFVNRYIDNVKINFSNVKKHFLPCLKLLLPVIAVAIYKFMDKTMIGVLSNIREVGFYENAEKIINVPSAIIGALGTVMLPRMSNMYSNGRDKDALVLIDKSMSLSMFLCFPMMFGLIAVSESFSVLYFGPGFEKTGILICLLACTSIFVSWGNVIRTQYLIPKEMDKDYIISAFLGAIVNFVINLILIPKYHAAGACFGTIVAEFVVMFYQTYKVRRFIEIKKYVKNVFPFFMKAVLMFCVVYMISFIKMNVVYLIFIQICFGVFVYCLLNIKYIKKILGNVWR